MISRIAVGGLLGAIAMFVWLSIAHMFTPLGQAGFTQLPNETSVTQALHTATGDKGALYLTPWEPDAMKDKAASDRYASKVKANGSSMILYRPSTEDAGMSPMQLLEEFLKELVVCVIVAFLLAEAKLPKLWERAGFVAAIGAVAALETNASNRIWYGFPGDFTAAAVLVSFVGYVFAGFAIGWWVKPSTPKPIE